MKRFPFLTTAFASVAVLALTGCASDGSSAGSSEGSVGASLMNTVASSLSSQLSTQTFDLNSLLSVAQLGSSPEGQKDLAGQIVAALQSYLYGGPEQIAAAASEGRGVSLDPDTMQVSVTDTPAKQTEALGFFSQLQGLTTKEGIINKLAELAVGKPKGAAAEGDVVPLEVSLSGGRVDYALIGDITPGSANLTIKTESAGEYTLALQDSTGTTIPLTFNTSELPGTSSYRGTTTATGLTTGTAYTLVSSNKVEAQFKTLEEFPDQVRLFFGSCMNFDQQTAKETQFPPKSDPEAVAEVVEVENNQLWSNIPESESFDAAFLIGDRFYLPSWYEDYHQLNTPEFMELMNNYHEGMMSIPGLKEFFARTPLYVTWDDHDFGPNNSATDFEFASQVLDYTKWSLPQPQMGTQKLPGAYFKANFGDLDVFVLDGRTYRDCSNRTVERNGKSYHSCGVDGVLQPNGEYLPDELLKTLYGKEQLDWLKKSLKSSDATVKLIVTGNQSLSNIHPFEAWYHYAERADFLGWLNQTRVPGVLFVGGDRHHGEVGVITKDVPYPLYELTASGLGVNTYGPDVDTPESPYDILGDTGMQHYGVVEYNRPDGSVSLILVGRNGQELHRTVVPVSELK